METLKCFLNFEHHLTIQIGKVDYIYPYSFEVQSCTVPDGSHLFTREALIEKGNQFICLTLLTLRLRKLSKDETDFSLRS